VTGGKTIAGGRRDGEINSRSRVSRRFLRGTGQGEARNRHAPGVPGSARLRWHEICDRVWTQRASRLETGENSQSPEGEREDQDGDTNASQQKRVSPVATALACFLRGLYHDSGVEAKDAKRG